jgi:hypothetical protein
VNAPAAVAIKRLLIRAASPALRRQMLAAWEHTQDLASACLQRLAWVGALPDFIIIGAQKGGTTYLYDELARHPGVVAARTKEIHFLDRYYNRGLDWYRAFFPRNLANGPEARALTGEASPGYLFHPWAAQRAYAVAPRARLIALLRNPVDRAYSHYQHEVRLGYEHLSFEAAIEQESDRLGGEAERLQADPAYDGFNHRHFAYLARGVYVDQLRAWREVFPAEQILVLQSEDFQKDVSVTLRRVLQFLGLPAWEPERRRHPKLFPYPPMKAETRRRLQEYFAPHNQRLREYLGIEHGWPA